MNTKTRALTRWISEREFYRVDERNDKKIFQLSTYTGFLPSKRIGYAYKSSIVQILKTHLNPLARSTIMLHHNWHSIRKNMWPLTATHLLAAILDVTTQPCTIMLLTANKNALNPIGRKSTPLLSVKFKSPDYDGLGKTPGIIIRLKIVTPQTRQEDITGFEIKK